MQPNPPPPDFHNHEAYGDHLRSSFHSETDTFKYLKCPEINPLVVLRHLDWKKILSQKKLWTIRNDLMKK